MFMFTQEGKGVLWHVQWPSNSCKFHASAKNLGYVYFQHFQVSLCVDILRFYFSSSSVVCFSLDRISWAPHVWSSSVSVFCLPSFCVKLVIPQCLVLCSGSPWFSLCVHGFFFKSSLFYFLDSVLRKDCVYSILRFGYHASMFSWLV